MAASSWPIIWTSSHRRSVSNCEMMDFSKVLQIRPVSTLKPYSRFVRCCCCAIFCATSDKFYAIGWISLGKIVLNHFALKWKTDVNKHTHTPCIDVLCSTILYGWCYTYTLIDEPAVFFIVWHCPYCFCVNPETVCARWLVKNLMNFPLPFF